MHVLHASMLYVMNGNKSVTNANRNLRHKKYLSAKIHKTPSFLFCKYSLQQPRFCSTTMQFGPQAMTDQPTSSSRVKGEYGNYPAELQPT